MANKKLIAVTGATGNIGKFVVEGLIKKGFSPRVIVQKYSDNPLWKSANVEQIIADFNDTESLVKAFSGAEKVFSLSPLVKNLVELGQKTVKAAEQAGVKQIVRSSALGADENAPIMMGRMHGTAEKIIENSGLEWTFIQPASFFQNYLGFAETIKNQNAFYIPLGDGKTSLVDVEDIAAVAVAALTEVGHHDKKYPVTGGEALSANEIAEIFSRVLVRQISYVDVPETKAQEQMLNSGMPDWLVNAVSELNQIGKAGYLADISPTVEQVLGRKPITFREFVEKNKAFFKE